VAVPCGRVPKIMNDCLTVPTGPNGDRSLQEDQDKKSKERREKDRKTLRMRKINSLKRQINIKEKMLEVSLNDLKFYCFSLINKFQNIC
jgi:hypothetical protein